MPSGSKKRKSSKKPKPPGGPPEQETGMEEAMENNGLEVGEATSSPRGFEGDPEAVGERGLKEGKEMNGEVYQDRDGVPVASKEGFQADEAAPEAGEGNPPPQPDPELEIPSQIEAEAPAVFELEGEPAHSKIEPQIDTPPMEFEAKADAAPEEIKSETELDAVPVEYEPIVDAAPEDIKPEMESNAMPVELEPITDAIPEEIKPETDLHAITVVSELVTDSGPDASPDEIKPDSDIGLDEVELPKESSGLERETVLDAGPIGSESGVNDSCMEKETKTDAAPADIEPVISKAPDEGKSEIDAAPPVESEIGEPLLEVKAEADATSYIELETNDAPDEVPVEVEPEMVGAPAESKPEMEAAKVEELEAAVPADIELETQEAPMEREVEMDAAPRDAEAEVQETLAEREVAIDAAPVDIEPATVAAPADTDAEIDTEKAVVQAEIDASPDYISPEMDSECIEKELVEIEQDVNAAALKAEKDEVSQAAIEEAPDPDSEVQALVERELGISAEDADNLADIKAKTEPPPETEAELKPLDVAGDKSFDPPQETLDVAADTSSEPPQEIEALGVAELTFLEPPQENEAPNVTEVMSLEPLQEIVSESEVMATNEAKPEEKASVEIKAEERGSFETESDQLDLIEGELGAETEPVAEASHGIDPQPEGDTSCGIESDAEAEVSQEAEPEPMSEAVAKPESEVEKSHGIELDDEAEVSLEAESEPVLKVLAADERFPIETEAEQQDLGDIEPDQSDVTEHDQQLQKQEGVAALGELDTSVSEDNQPSDIQPQAADALEVPIIEDKPSAINEVDDSSSPTSSSEAINNANCERTEIEQEPEEGKDTPPSATALEDEAERMVESVSDNQRDLEQTVGTTVDNEQGAADELWTESKDFCEKQERAVNFGHDEDGAVLASAGNGIDTGELIEQKADIERPMADVEDSAKDQERAVDVGHDADGAEAEESSERESDTQLPLVDVEVSTKEGISEQERAIDVGHEKDGTVFALAGNGSEAEVSSEQKVGIELPTTDVIDLEEFAKEGPLSSHQKLVIEQDEQDLSQALGTSEDERPSAEPEQNLNASLTSSASEMASGAPMPQDEVVTTEFDEKIALEHGFSPESVCDELERDIGEEEAVSSTVAEVGSVLNDFDERVSYEQELHTEFSSIDQEVDIPSAESEQSLTAITSFASEPQDETLTPANEVASEHEHNLESAWGKLERGIGEEEVALLLGAEVGCVFDDLDERASYEHTDFSSTERDLDAPDFKEYDGELSTEVNKSDTGLREQQESESSPAKDSEENAIKTTTSEQQEVLLEVADAVKPAENLPSTVKESLSDEQLLLSPQPEQVLPMFAGDELISKASTYLENEQQNLSRSEAPSNALVEHSVHQSDVNNANKVEIHGMVTKEQKEAGYTPMGGDTNNDADEALVESASLIPEGKDTTNIVQAFCQDRALEQWNLKSKEQPGGGGALERRTKLLGCCGMFDLLLGRN